MQALLDHFRCPESFFELRLTRPVCPDPGFFRFGPHVTCYGRSSSGFRRPQVRDVLYDTATDVTGGDGIVTVPFDPDDIATSLRHESYWGAAAANPTERATLRRLYYACVRPLLPSPVRRLVQRAALRGWDRLAFPQWPVDATVDRLLEALLAAAMQRLELPRVPFVWFWPEGASACVMMTHDVDNRRGRDFCSRLMTLDESVGIKSSFQIVPERRYAVSDTFLDEFRTRGFEVNIHDLNHDGRLFSTHDEFLRRAARINEYGRRFLARGFRSGTLYRNQAWYAALEFSYDMSVPSVAHLDPQKGGCCSVTPFFIGGILELPLTTTQDYSLFHILQDYSIALWDRQLRAITERHGLASFNAHPECLVEGRAQTVYRTLLDHLADARDTGNVWIALPGDVDRWWRERRQTSVVPASGGWGLHGPAARRARLAFATVDGDRLAFTIDDAARH